MKTLYLIGGTMGVGKTTVGQHLKRILPNSVFLDGDWCWDSNPFQVTEETKAMVMRNICFLLNQFLQCTAYEHVIFCWVMHEQAIINRILGEIHGADCEIRLISLICEEAALESRLNKDIHAGIRGKDILEKSIARIPCYHQLNTIKIDTTGKTIAQITEEILGS